MPIKRTYVASKNPLSALFVKKYNSDTIPAVVIGVTCYNLFTLQSKKKYLSLR